MSKNFILVTGPESSGTRLITRILIEMGYKGEYSHEQTLDDSFKNNSPLHDSKIVFRRSVPHANEYPNYIGIRKWAIDNEYSFKTIIIVRNYIPCIISKINRKHLGLSNYETLTEQYSFIFENIPYLFPFLLLSTSLLTTRPKRGLMEISSFLSENIPKINFIYDMDKKYINKEEEF